MTRASPKRAARKAAEKEEAKRRHERYRVLKNSGEDAYIALCMKEQAARRGMVMRVCSKCGGDFMVRPFMPWKECSRCNPA